MIMVIIIKVNIKGQAWKREKEINKQTVNYHYKIFLIIQKNTYEVVEKYLSKSFFPLHISNHNQSHVCQFGCTKQYKISNSLHMIERIDKKKQIISYLSLHDEDCA